MKQVLYGILLFFLRSLIYVKRALLLVFRLLGRIFLLLRTLYARTVGFRVYRVWLSARKTLVRVFPSLGSNAGFFTRRGTLQTILLVALFITMIPHTKLYTRNDTTVAGRKTVLYRVLGPGDQNFQEEEELIVDVAQFAQPGTRSYREGAVVSESPVAAGETPVAPAQEISSISAGGGAITKPTILPGSSLPAEGAVPTTGRTELVIYEVEPGDVVGKIAEKFGVSVETILWANNLSARSYIRPGDQLKILPTTGVLHEVKRGDTVIKIASTYGAEAKDVIAHNKLKNDGSDIVIGEVLIIPDGRRPSAAPAPRASTRSYTALRSVSAPPPSVTAPAGSGYLWPTSVRHITQYYGWRHTAVDIAGPVGTPVYASRSGTVVKSQCGWNGGYGCYIIIDHGDGIQTLYAHHSQLYVSSGQDVTQGQTIAAMGSTGRSTGPHVHFEVRSGGGRVNPLQYVR